MNDTIPVLWRENGINYSKTLNRADVEAVFKGLQEGFRDDNEIATVFVERIIPNAESIYINKDLNSTQDIPMVAYKIDNQLALVKVKRYHKIVWSILNKYCTK